MLNSWFKSWDISFNFQVFWMKIHSKLNRFRIKKLDCYIVSDLRFLLEIQAILPETSPFLSAQMAVLSSFFQMFIVLGMYNFVFILKGVERLTLGYLMSACETVRRRSSETAVTFLYVPIPPPNEADYEKYLSILL